MTRHLIVASAIALFSITACATGSAQTETTPVTSNQTQATSNADFETTNARLKAALENRGLTIFAIVDHAAGAAKVDQTLAPNTLYIFGNPKAGTPLMLANPDLGLDLPLKAQVREDNGTVLVNVTDIRAVTARAGVSEPSAVINKIAETLDAIKAEAIG